MPTVVCKETMDMIWMGDCDCVKLWNFLTYMLLFFQLQTMVQLPQVATQAGEGEVHHRPGL